MHPPRAAPAFGPAGPEFRANTFSTGGSLTPKVAVDAAGDFVVAWQSANRAGAGSDLDIFAQRFSAAGVPQGGEFQVNTYTTDRQNVPAVALARRATSSSPGTASPRTAPSTASTRNAITPPACPSGRRQSL